MNHAERMYCVDANIFIASWNSHYPIRIMPSLWEKIANHRDSIILIKPIFDEIDPVSPTDKKLPQTEKDNKYPLRMWLEGNNFDGTAIDDETKRTSLELGKIYQTDEISKGASQNDVTLIAYAKIKNEAVVTFEAKQKQVPDRKSNYKIPLICEENDVECINFIEMLGNLGIKI